MVNPAVAKHEILVRIEVLMPRDGTVWHCDERDEADRALTIRLIATVKIHDRSIIHRLHFWQIRTPVAGWRNGCKVSQ
jgi:hypothetical protein